MDVPPVQIRVQASGTHPGTVILRPDEELACRGPAMTTTWNGVLEFPIKFHVQDDQPE